MKNPPITMNLTVFCGASDQTLPQYTDAAQAFGKLFPSHGIRLVYGGSHLGLMGALADGVLQAGGEVYGVMPQKLKDREIAHEGCTQFFTTPDMHQRKLRMYELADQFAVLPGGFGTLEEAFEVITWNQLGYLKKPLSFINIHGYFDSIAQFCKQAEQKRFIKVFDSYAPSFFDNFDRFFESLHSHKKPSP